MAVRKKISENLATKEGLQQVIAKLTDKIEGVRFELKNEIKEVKSEIKNDVLNSHDEIMKKLNDISTDKLVLTGQYRRHDDQINSHETRIKTLEEKVLV